jgi:RNA polymerase sigma-70 factor, ECF subfamily
MDRFTTIWEAYHQPILRRIRRQVADPQVAEDLLQDVFLTVFTRLDDVRQPDRLIGWIGQIARNRVIDYYRARRPQEPVPETLVAPVTDDDQATLRRLSRCLPGLIAQLPESSRRAIELTTGGMSQIQLSAHLEISPTGARAQVQRARARLKQQLLACCTITTDAAGRLVDAVPQPGACDDGRCGSACDA